MPFLSVIICTYSPAPGIFTKCLEAITIASFQQRPDEILIIDNNSPVPLAREEYIREFIHQNRNTRVILEERQGLTNARIRGITEAKGELLVFIDDDNIVAENFFLMAARIATNYPFIGAFSGQVLIEYEKAPPAWTQRYWGLLVHRKFDGNHWSNLMFNNETMPCGAGLCIRREVGYHYIHLHKTGKRNFYLDRSKGSLLSGGDNDLAMCACDIGKGMGLFQDLQLRHHIPQSRFSLQYLSRLAHGIYYSSVILQYLRTGKIDAENWTARFKHLARISLMKSHDRIIQIACRKGLNEARKMLQSNNPK
jgi:glycosyltransferase involved in cell wall biosynthesis